MEGTDTLWAVTWNSDTYGFKAEPLHEALFMVMRELVEAPPPRTHVVAVVVSLNVALECVRLLKKKFKHKEGYAETEKVQEVCGDPEEETSFERRAGSVPENRDVPTGA